MGRLADWDWSTGPLSVNFDPEADSLKAKTASSDSLLFHCRYGAGPGMDVLREETALEPMVKKVLLQSAGRTVQSCLNTLQAVPRSKESVTPLSEGTIVKKLLTDETLSHHANVVLKFNSTLLPEDKLFEPFVSLQSICEGPRAASMKVFANLTSKDMNVRNLILR